MLKAETIKFIAPAIELTPAKCNANILISTDAPEWHCIPDKGGYIVHPHPEPDSIKLENNRKKIEGGNSQKLTLFRRGKDISDAPNNKGKNQLP
jgi:hypothetical protein